MRWAARAFDFFVYSNLFIAGCAVIMVQQTDKLLLHTNPDKRLLGFVFFASLCSYSFHWWLSTDAVPGPPSPRTSWLGSNRVVHLLLFFAGISGACFYGMLLLDHWHWLLLSAFITFLYSAPKIPHPWLRALRKIAIGKTIFLAMVWMYVTTLLPLLISEQVWRTDFTLFAAGRFFLIYAICILFDYRDREYDRSIGIRSLITWLSEKAIAWLFSLSLLLFAAFSLWLLAFDYSPLAVGILLLPGLITAALYRYATRHFSDLLYYFLLDGLMALSALLMLIPGI